MDGSLARPAPRRRGLAAVYAVAAATALVPCVLIVSQLRTVRAEHLPMLAVGLFLNPVTLVPALLAIKLGLMARRLAAGSTHAERDAIVFERWAAAFAVALGALSGWAIRQAAESTARGGGLLSAFAYLPLLAAAYLGALAVASWTVRRGFRAAAPRDALRARDPAPAEPGDRRS